MKKKIADNSRNITRKPVLNEAYEYVKSHVYMPFSVNEFCIIEEYVIEKHDNLARNEHYGDADLENFVYRKLEKAGIIIPQHKVEAILEAMYDFMCENGLLLPISLEGQFDKWMEWDTTLSDAIRSFKLEYDSYPTILRLSEQTKSQIEYVNSISPKSKIYGELVDNYTYSDVIDNSVETCTVKFVLEDDIPHKMFILQETPVNDDDDDDDNRDFSTCTPRGGPQSEKDKSIKKINQWDIS